MLSRLGDRFYRATLTYPLNLTQSFELRGDEWRIDARVLKWRGLANIAGFDTVYRLERIGGRYRDIDSERGAPRTVHVLNQPARIDAWALRRCHPLSLTASKAPSSAVPPARRESRSARRRRFRARGEPLPRAPSARPGRY